MLARDSTLREHRLADLPRRDGVCVTVPPGKELRARDGLEVQVHHREDREVTTLAGLRTTVPAHALAELVPRLDRPGALAVLDAARRAGATAEVLLDRLQERLRDSTGRISARPDMTIDAARRRRPARGPLHVEADGRGPHSSPKAAFRDREKASAILGDDGDVERSTWDGTFDPMRIPWRLRRAL